MQINNLIDSLLINRRLTKQDYRAILESENRDTTEYLGLKAREVTLSNFGRGIFVRGLIEITNRCRNNCLYCGIRASNRELNRYTLSHEEILECCRRGSELGLKSFVLQGGEDPTMSDEWMVELVEMIGIGPFIPHHDTPFAECRAGSVEKTLRLISIFRLIHPKALIPSTTALASLSKDGRKRGVLAGANVVMPNISPTQVRADYSLYDNKVSFGSESGEGIELLKRELAEINYHINFERGDYKS